MSDSNRTRTSLVVEATPGTTPATPTMLVIPKTSFNVGQRTRYVESQLIRADANIQSVQKVSSAVAGSLATELMRSESGESIHALKSAAFRATETAAATEVLSVTASSGVLSATGIHTGVEVGDLVRVRSPDDGTFLAFVPVTAVGTGSITVSGSVPNGSSYAVQRGPRLKNGTTDTHFSIEHARLDANLFKILRGVGIGSMGLRIADEQITELTFGVEGMNGTRAGTAYGSSYTSHADVPSYTATRVPLFQLGGATYELLNMSIAFDNRLAARRRAGSDGPTSIRRGSFYVSGTITCYLDAWTELIKHDAGSSSDFSIAMLDELGNCEAIRLPQLKWTEATDETGGKDQDDFAVLNFQGELDPAEGITARWLRWLAV